MMSGHTCIYTVPSNQKKTMLNELGPHSTLAQTVPNFTSSQRTLRLQIGSCRCQKPCFDPEDRILHLGHKWGNQVDGLPTGTPLLLLVLCGSCLNLFWFSILSSQAWHMQLQAEWIKMCDIILHYTELHNKRMNLLGIHVWSEVLTVVVM